MAHPHCPCTRATLGELAVLMARVQKRVNAVVVFVVPNGVPEKWEETDLWRNAAQIPGVRVLKDVGGKEAAVLARSLPAKRCSMARTEHCSLAAA